MMFLDKKGERKAKGIKRVLEERGCLPLRKLPNVKCKKRCYNPVVYLIPVLNKPPCCLAVYSLVTMIFSTKSRLL
jgi:hypothetical protein